MTFVDSNSLKKTPCKVGIAGIGLPIGQKTVFLSEEKVRAVEWWL